MALQKPQITVCIDNKTHSWMTVAVEEKVDQDKCRRLEHRWCRKCGCLTQVGFITDDSQPVVATNDDDTPYLVNPKILDALIK